MKPDGNLGLKWNDLDWIKRTIKVERQLVRGEGVKLAQPKTSNAKRMVMLGDRTIEVLRLHYGRQNEERRKAGENWSEYGLIFTSTNGTPIHFRNLLRDFKSLLKRTGLPEMTIAGDNVDAVLVDYPRRWDIAFIRRFMLTFGSLSSVFDLLTFGVLLWAMQANQILFHTGWFVESVLSAVVVVFALRTRLPFHQSKPSRPMLAISCAVAVIALALPYSLLAELLGFKVLPPLYFVAIFGIILAYFTSAEMVKRWFFHRFA